MGCHASSLTPGVVKRYSAPSLPIQVLAGADVRLVSEGDCRESVDRASPDCGDWTSTGGRVSGAGASTAGGGCVPVVGASTAGGGCVPAVGASTAGGGCVPAVGASTAGGVGGACTSAIWARPLPASSTVLVPAPSTASTASTAAPPAISLETPIPATDAAIWITAPPVSSPTVCRAAATSAWV